MGASGYLLGYLDEEYYTVYDKWILSENTIEIKDLHNVENPFSYWGTDSGEIIYFWDFFRKQKYDYFPRI